jgi:sigma-B regulation protein RsbU (phosphoserine phosphatase)
MPTYAADGGMRFANAGHPPPFHVRRAAGEVERLQHAGEKPGPALGFVPNATYSTFERSLAPGDLLMLFTDGLYEIDGPGDTLYEMSQLTEAIARRRALPTPELLDDLVAELRHFSVTGEFGDDMPDRPGHHTPARWPAGLTPVFGGRRRARRRAGGLTPC